MLNFRGVFLVDELYIFLVFATLLSVEGPKAKGAQASVEGFVRQPGLSKAKAEHIIRFDDLDWDGQNPGFQQDFVFFVSPLKSLSYYFFFCVVTRFWQHQQGKLHECPFGIPDAARSLVEKQTAC